MRLFRVSLGLTICSCLLLALMACGAASQPRSPEAVVRAAIEAIDKGQGEKAAGLFAEDSELVTAFGQPKGKQEIRDFIVVNVVKMKTRAKSKDLQSNGETVTGTFALTNAALVDEFAPKPVPPFFLKALIQGGKIKYMEWSTSPIQH